MAPVERKKQLHVFLSEDEERMVRELADLDGMTASDVVRQLIRRAHVAKFGEKKATKKPKK